MTNDICVVDNRTFLLGLDGLYREAIKPHERGELLLCARRIAGVLGVGPGSGPVEGYYPEHPELAEYFRLVRALQAVEEEREAAVSSLPEFRRLLAVVSSPLYGRPQRCGKLLPAGRDPLSQALYDTRPAWTADRLTAAAYSAALEYDDISLAGLAARLRDGVVLTALRESAVLYAEVAELGMPPKREYLWKVDWELAAAAGRFIAAFKELFGSDLPSPEGSQAERYWNAFADNPVAGRCVRLGFSSQPALNYHWAVYPGLEGGLAVQEFWHREVWTTDRYRAALKGPGPAAI